MIGKLALLSLLALTQGKPYDGSLSAHDLCPEDQRHYLLPHEYDCTLFYYCEYGYRYDKPTSCAPGTEFSAELQVCIHPSQANCTLPGIPPTEEVDNGNQDGDNKPEVPVPVESDEQKTEGEEVNPAPVEAQPESEEQTPEVGVETPASVESEEQKPETEEEPPVEPQPESEEQKPEVEEQTPEPENEKPEPPKDLLPNGCPADIHEHWLLPHETECNKFYYCNFGEKVLTSCAPGTYFNYEIQVCDWPENVNCANTDSGSEDNNSNENGNGNGENENGSGDNENGSGDNENGSGDHENGSGDNENGSGENENGSGDNGNNGGDGWLPNGCPDSDDVHHLLPHETECGKFYQCVHGAKVELECPNGLQFNPVLQVCDIPENVGCQGAGNGENSEEDNGNEVEDNGDNNVDSGENNGNGESDLANGCPSDFSVHRLLPHESDCSKFYYCNFGSKVVESCPDGLHFNPEIQVCDWPWNANCENNDDGDGNENNSGENNTDNENSNSGENNGDNGENNGNGESDLANGCPSDFSVHRLLPHESDCSKFYYCNFGSKVVESCPDGLHFNPEIQVCDWPWDANCENNDGGDGDDNNSGENNTDNENGNSGEDNGDNGENNGHSEENNNNSGVDNGNSGENNGNSEEDNGNGEDGEEVPDHSKCSNTCNTQPWAHAYHCDKFWRCDGEKATLVVCSEGLFFNSKTGTCDFRCNVDCVRDHIQTTANAEGLKIFVPWNKVDENVKKSYNML